MATTLASIIGYLKKNPKGQQKLKVILGDGYDPTLELLPPKKILGREIVAPSEITPNEHDMIWIYYEYVRLKTYNQTPDQLLFFLTRLAKEGILSCIITTNYDCYWKSIRDRKVSDVRIFINPLSGSSKDGYYDKVPAKKDKCLTVYMIHGRLDFIRFNTCRHRFSLPKFIINSNPQHIINKFNPPICHWWEEGGLCESVSLYRHDVDWLNEDNRIPYEGEINSAREILNEDTTAAILVLGFKGFYSEYLSNPRRNEELVPVLEGIAQRGKIPIWVVNTNRQYESMNKNGPEKYLVERIKKYSNVRIIKADDQLSVWLANYLQRYFDLSEIDTFLWQLEFQKRWIDSNKFISRAKF